jgi:cyanate permease
MVWSAVMLFNESIMAERGFNQAVSVQILAILTGVGLLSNLVAGALTTRARIGRLLGIGLMILAAALGLFPVIDSVAQVRAYAVGMGVTGGIIMVVFFAVWGHMFGRQHLGKIQGAAQLISVLASALGPVPMAWCQERTGSYMPMFTVLAVSIAVLAAAAFVVPLPALRRTSGVEATALDAPFGSLQTVQD